MILLCQYLSSLFLVDFKTSSLIFTLENNWAHSKAYFMIVRAFVLVCTFLKFKLFYIRATAIINRTGDDRHNTIFAVLLNFIMNFKN